MPALIPQVGKYPIRSTVAVDSRPFSTEVAEWPLIANCDVTIIILRSTCSNYRHLE